MGELVPFAAQNLGGLNLAQWAVVAGNAYNNPSPLARDLGKLARQALNHFSSGSRAQKSRRPSVRSRRGGTVGFNPSNKMPRRRYGKLRRRSRKRKKRGRRRSTKR